VREAVGDRGRDGGKGRQGREVRCVEWAAKDGRWGKGLTAVTVYVWFPCAMTVGAGQYVVYAVTTSVV